MGRGNSDIFFLYNLHIVGAQHITQDSVPNDKPMEQ